MLRLLLIVFFISRCDSCSEENLENDVLTCVGQNLTSFPSNISETVTTLILTNNHIRNISLMDMQNYPNLVHLNLSSNSITTGDDLKALQNSTNLKVFDNSNNKILYLDLWIFLKNVKLEELVLDGNINMKVYGTIPWLPELERLSLRDCQLTQLPKDFRRIPKIKVLDFRGNDILNISMATIESVADSAEIRFDNCPELEDGSLSLLKAKNITMSCQDDTVIRIREDLTSFPSDISKTVKSINLADNDIRSMTAADIKEFLDLRYLNLRGNTFTNLNIIIFSENTKLKELIFDDNVDIILQGTIPKLPQLERLSLRDCRLTQLPTDFSGIPNIKILDFRGNDILCISMATIESVADAAEMRFDNRPALDEGSISLLKAKNITISCQDDTVIRIREDLTSFPSGIGKTVKSINLADNNIRSITTADLKDFLNLRYLNLRGNTFRNLNLIVFSENTKLKELILDDNVDVILQGTIPKLPQLERLSLRDCQLTQLPTDFSGIPNIKILDFRGNDILCISMATIESVADAAEMRFDNRPALDEGSISLLKAKNITISCQDDTVIRIREDLTSFPSGIGKTVKSINLADNNIRSITTADLKDFLNLRYLNLRGNTFTNLNLTVFSENTKLKELILDDNVDVMLQGTIPKLPQLEKLSLRDCQLTQLPTDFSGIPNIKILDFRGNLNLEVSVSTIISIANSVKIRFDNCPALDIRILEAKNITLLCTEKGSQSVIPILVAVIVVLLLIYTGWKVSNPNITELH